MRILYIAHTTDKGGGTIALLNIIHEIIKTHEIGVFLPSKTGWLVDALKETKCTLFFSKFELYVYPKSIISHYGKWNPIGYLKSCKALYNKISTTVNARRDFVKVLSEYAPQIVHCNCGPLDISLDACRKLEIPHVWHLREYQDLDFDLYVLPSMQRFIKKLHTKGNYNIAITHGVYNHFKLREIDSVIYDGVFDNTEQKTYVDYPKKNYILFVGRVEEAKGLDLLLHAFGEFHKRYDNIQLLIAGDFPNKDYLSKCKSIINRYNLSDAIRFLGQRKDVYQLMQDALFLVVPSRFEGFGFVTAEAMFNSCLVIGRDVAGTKEQLDNGLKLFDEEIGLRFITKEELITSMYFAMTHDLTSMKERAFNTAIQLYSKENQRKKLLSFYNNIYMAYYGKTL